MVLQFLSIRLPYVEDMATRSRICALYKFDRNYKACQLGVLCNGIALNNLGNCRLRMLWAEQGNRNLADQKKTFLGQLISPQAKSCGTAGL
jgi:hypothetical protein